jgi:Zn-dependent M28 family amino/carboxypeptidase
VVPGRVQADRYIVISAHYDHLGTRGDTIYNGADDDASGTAALLALARHFARRPAEHSLIFAAFDAEEMGLQGARAFVAAPPVPREAIALDVNMDMVSRNSAGELYAAGAHHYPALRPVLEQVAAGAPVKLRLGHDAPGLPPGDDWTQSSDHGPFHASGIPFVYFGVEDHPDYHKPTDDVERIDPGFYVRAVSTVLSAVNALDAALAQSGAPSR